MLPRFRINKHHTDDLEVSVPFTESLSPDSTCVLEISESDNSVSFPIHVNCVKQFKNNNFKISEKDICLGENHLIIGHLNQIVAASGSLGKFRQNIVTLQLAANVALIKGADVRLTLQVTNHRVILDMIVEKFQDLIAKFYSEGAELPGVINTAVSSAKKLLTLGCEMEQQTLATINIPAIAQETLDKDELETNLFVRRYLRCHGVATSCGDVWKQVCQSVLLEKWRQMNSGLTKQIAESQETGALDTLMSLFTGSASCSVEQPHSPLNSVPEPVFVNRKLHLKEDVFISEKTIVDSTKNLLESTSSPVHKLYLSQPSFEQIPAACSKTIELSSNSRLSNCVPGNYIVSNFNSAEVGWVASTPSQLPKLSDEDLDTLMENYQNLTEEEQQVLKTYIAKFV